MLRIVAGEFRSRRLITPDDATVSRPYTDRVKETVFNLLRGWFDGTTVLDLFAGVGTIGLEAVSRGAARVVMVEKNRAIYELLKQNIASLQCEDRATAVMADALGPTALAQVSAPVGLIFVDPPYEMMQVGGHRGARASGEGDTGGGGGRRRVLDQIKRCRLLMGERGFVILRSPIGRDEADFAVTGFEGPEDHGYGSEMHVLLYAPAPNSTTHVNH